MSHLQVLFGGNFDLREILLSSEFRKRLGHLAPGSALSPGPMDLGGGRPRSLELDGGGKGGGRPRASPLRQDAVSAASGGVRNAVGAGSGEDHVVRSSRNRLVFSQLRFSLTS